MVQFIILSINNNFLKMDFEIVLACDQEYGIGTNRATNTNTIPWKIKDDMAYFSKVTSQSTENGKKNVIIMGRATADTFQKPLPRRTNVVITSNPLYKQNQGFEVYETLDSALNHYKDDPNVGKVFVIGGSIIADYAIKHKNCKGVHLTEIPNDYGCEIKLTPGFLDLIKNYIKDPSGSHYEKTDTSTVDTFCKTLNKNIRISINKYTYIAMDLKEELDTESPLKKQKN